jgi:putative aldouronate transport system permease protein
MENTVNLKNTNVMSKKRFHPSILLIHLIVGVVCALFLLPMLMVISISFTPEALIRVNGFSLLPASFTLDAYKYIFIQPITIIRAYGVSITVTVCGTAIGLSCTSALAYVISRKDFAYRQLIMMFVFITMLFSGGLAASYIWVARALHFKDTIFALILPGAMAGWNVILMRGFFGGLPPSIIESAKIDGASELKTFIRVVLPVSTPGLATVGLFIALNYWNDWFSSLLYINDAKNLYSLQFMLYRILKQIDTLKNLATLVPGLKVDANLPSLSARMAMCIVAAGPMLVAFASLQKYFVTGITLGSVKG